MQKLEGKVALITGASSGIGMELARELARRGVAVAILARRVERLKALEDEIRAAGGRALAIACDVTLDGEVERAVALTRMELGPIDLAVANAGFGVAGRMERLSVDDVRRQFETNVFGVLRTFYSVLEDLKRTRGRLALVGSVSAYVANTGTGAYAMSKFAVRALAETLWLELAPAGVSVTLINPGFVDSDIRRVDNRGHLHPDARDPIPKWLRMPADEAARQIAGALEARRREVIVTGHGKALVFASRHLPGALGQILKRAGAKRPEPGRKKG